MTSGRAWRATRPHISFRTLEVAVVARLGEHCCGGSGRATDRGESEVVVVVVLGVLGRAGAGEKRFQLEQVEHVIQVGSIGGAASSLTRPSE